MCPPIATSATRCAAGITTAAATGSNAWDLARVRKRCLNSVARCRGRDIWIGRSTFLNWRAQHRLVGGRVLLNQQITGRSRCRFVGILGLGWCQYGCLRNTLIRIRLLILRDHRRAVHCTTDGKQDQQHWFCERHF